MPPFMLRYKRISSVKTRRASSCFWRHVRFRSSLLSTASEPLKQGTGELVLAGLVEVARRRGGWLRPIHKWRPPQASPFVQFRSLVKHLFARYRVPNFMTSVWLRSPPDAAWLDLFLHLGRGKSIRQFKTPIRLTKRMARYFMLAPDDLTVEQALRWAQVRGMGGNARLARTVIQTILAVPSADEPFEESLMEFLVRNWPMSLDEVRQVIQFVHDQRFQPADVTWGLEAGPEKSESFENPTESSKPSERATLKRTGAFCADGRKVRGLTLASYV